MSIVKNHLPRNDGDGSPDSDEVVRVRVVVVVRVELELADEGALEGSLLDGAGLSSAFSSRVGLVAGDGVGAVLAGA